MSYNVLVATYNIEECFIIPKNIDIEDRTQVVEHWVRRRTLHIKLTNGKVITIHSQGLSDNMKYPDSTRVENAADYGYEPDDFEEDFDDVDLGIFETHETKVYTDIMDMFTANDEPEPQPQPQSQPNENTLYVRRFTFNGKKYLKSRDNRLFDEETKEQVGVWNDETQQIDEIIDSDDEEEHDGVCYECGKEGKFIGKEKDDWLCDECNCI